MKKDPLLNPSFGGGNMKISSDIDTLITFYCSKSALLISKD
jgi:hypothetical protein